MAESLLFVLCEGCEGQKSLIFFLIYWMKAGRGKIISVSLGRGYIFGKLGH